jgi:hypothetical protein
MSDIYIEDGYQQARTIPAVSGLHPELLVIFRPALDKERNTYRLKSQSSDPAVLDQHATDLILKYVVSINGAEQKDKEKVARLKPAIRSYLTDLILGYLPADEAKDAGN